MTYSDMDLKDYRNQPDEGIFERIEKRVRMRHMARVGGMVALVDVVAVALWVAFAPKGGETVVVEAAGVPTIASAETQPAVSLREKNDTLVGQRNAIGSVSTDRTVVYNTVETQPTLSPRETNNTAVAKGDVSGSVSTDMAIANSIVETTAPRKDVINSGDAAVSAPADVVVLETLPAVSQENQVAAPVKSGDPTSAPVHIDNLVWAPNVIVPNGDVDENRTFKFKYSSNVTDFHIYIYNRGGRLVYRSDDPSFVWDGTHNGSALPQGAYVWVVKFRDTDGRPCQEKGTVTIVR